MSKRPNWWKFAYETEPDIENLKRILHDDSYDFDAHDEETEFRHKATQLKYEAMTAIPTSIEKTMTPEQLFHAQSPLWAREYTIQQLYYYAQIHPLCTDYERIDKIMRMGEHIPWSIDLLKNITVAPAPGSEEPN
mgnify:FL=1